jgi:ribose/xylose/arabinose/galactoside ABC-type transport system permease subunit
MAVDRLRSRQDVGAMEPSTGNSTTELARSRGVSPPNQRIAGIGSEVIRAREFGILLFLILTVIALSMARSTFLTESNVLAMGRQMSETAIVAVAMTFLITSRELDLSVGSIFGCCTLIMALLAQDQGVDLWLALVAALGVASLIGLANGLITTVGRIPSFIVTLGMLYIVRGAALKLSAYPVARIEHSTFYDVLAGEIAGIPVQIFWMLGIVTVGTLVFRRTTFGYQVRATGSNEAAARLAGIPVNRIKVTAFVLTALAATFAGALSFARLTSAAPTGGTGLELTVIAAVVIGGTSLFGGQGTIVGTFLGAALLTVVRNGLVQLGWEGRLQEAFLGGIVILAVLIHTHIGRRR